MTTKKELHNIAMKARARKAKISPACHSCGNRHCGCTFEMDEPVAPVSPEDIKNIVVDCAEQLGLVSETHVSLLIETAIQAIEGPDIPSAEDIKALIETCIRTDAELKLFILDCLPESGAGLGQVKELIDACLANLDIPEQVSDDHIKSQVLFCLIEFQNNLPALVTPIVEGLLPEPVDVKSTVLQCLLDVGMTEARVKLIFNECIQGLIPTDQHIKDLFVQCLSDWDIAPECIKNFVVKCVIELLPKPVTEADVKCFVDSCYGDQLHTEAQILAIVNTALISAPKPRTDEEINAIIDEAVTDDRIKVQVLECLNALPGRQWTQDEIKALIESCTRTDAELKLFIEQCVEVPSESLINSIAKTVALQCINENQPVVPTETQIKALILDCLKDLDFGDGGGTVVGVDSVSVSGQCANNTLTVSVNVDGVSDTALIDLSKFANQGGGISLADVQNYVATLEFVSQTQAKSLFEQCLNDSVGDDRFCVNLVSMNWNQSTGLLQTSIQDACGTKSDSVLIDTGVSETQANTLIDQYLTNNIDRFCVDDIDFAFVPNSGQLTVSVTDGCGIKSASVFIPVDAGGNNGITADAAKAIALQCIIDQNITQPTDQEISDLAKIVAQACVDSANYTTPEVSKSIAQGCINDAVNDPRFCNSNLNLSLIGTNLSATITDNCGIQSDSVDISGIIPEQQTYCMTGILQNQVGQVVTLTFNQENCPPQQVSFTAGSDGNGSVECCNTAAIGSVDVDNKTAEIIIAQSVGADVTATLELEPLLASILELTPATLPDGCTEYQSLRLCGQEIGQLPVLEPVRDCKCITLPAGFSGEVQLKIVQTGTTQTIDWGENGRTSSGPSGSYSVYTYALSNSPRTITICHTNPCDGITYTTSHIGLPSDAVCGCCDC